MAPTLIDEIINSIDPDQVPLEFISMAKVTTTDGIEKIMTKVDLDQFAIMMSDPRRYNIAEARVIIDIEKVKEKIFAETEIIYENYCELIKDI